MAHRSMWLKAGIHALWWIVMLMALSVFLFSKWEGYPELHKPCGAAAHCANPMRLTDEGAADLEQVGLSADYYAVILVVFMSIANLSFLAVGAWLYRYRGRDGFALAASLFLIIIGTIFTADAEALSAYPLLTVFFRVLDGVGSFYLPFLFLFPDGRFVPRWTIVPSLLWTAVQMFRFVFPELWTALNWNATFMTALVLLTHGPVLYALRHRYTRAAGDEERRRLKWFLYSVLAYMGTGMLFAVQYGHGLLQLAIQTSFFAGLLFWPFSIGIGMAVREHGAASPALQRTLLASVLGFMTVLLYVAAVGAATLLLQGKDALAALIASGIIAVLFQPLRVRLQRSVNRLVYGEPETPLQILTRLVEMMEQVVRQEPVWTDVARGLAQALKLPYAAILLAGREGDGAEAAAFEYGERHGPVTEIPLQWSGERVGTVCVGAPLHAQRLSGDAGALLEQLIRQISVAAHAARLADQLRQSRERLVTAREEERRRLGRDLHDGLGAGLASLLLRTDAIADRLQGDETASRGLQDVQAGIEEAIYDIRRLVYALRPPVLDEFGLLFAVRELAARYDSESFRVTVEAEGALPALSAAAEVAVYRIVQEALANARKHAGAGRCEIAFGAPEAGLSVAIRDDGAGLAGAYVPGIGIRSMKERAEELGGSCEVEPDREGGTVVRVRIPAAREEKADAAG